jgi:aryl-alcohol dehydrogenase-like predicted oxidoreductase
MQQLPKIRYGQSELEISRVGVGTAPIGTTPEWRINWGPQDEGDAMRAIEAALDLGVNWIDTAPFYGWGRAEQIVGRALHGKRDQVYIFTKCGTIHDADGGWHDDLSPASIRREVEQSLHNLQTDYIDLYQFHDPDPNTPVEESWATMQALIHEGKVRYGGLSNYPPDLMERALTVGPVAGIQHQYSMLSRAVEQDVLPFAREHGLGVLTWSPLASGFLTDGFDLYALPPDDFRRWRHPFGQEPAYSTLVEVRRQLQAIAASRQKTLAELALAWVLRHMGLTFAIVGVRNEREAQALPGALNWELTDEDLQAVEVALAPWEQLPESAL